MGSKKRIFYATPQKKIRQRWRNQYEEAKLRPKIKHPYVEMHKDQIKFIKQYLRYKGFYSSRMLYAFYNKIIKFNDNWPNSLITKETGFLTIYYLQNLLIIPDIKLSPKLLNKKIFKQARMSRLKQLFSLLYFEKLSLSIVGLEVQTLFLLGNSNQQHYLNTLGLNHRFFKTMSSGRCLRRSFGYQVSKSLKKSIQLNKALVDYYFEESTFGINGNVHTHTVLKPFNKKSLLLLDQIQNNALYYPTVLGFTKYYKINYKTARRIKKKIKKNLTSENLKRKPYKVS